MPPHTHVAATPGSTEIDARRRRNLRIRKRLVARAETRVRDVQRIALLAFVEPFDDVGGVVHRAKRAEELFPVVRGLVGPAVSQRVTEL